MERKVAAAFQCRMGPTRAGWKGTLQSIADVLKLVSKEKITPLYADTWLHFIAPMICLSACFMAFIVIPFSPKFQILNISLGIIYWSSVSSFGILGMLIAGWSSYNKWALLSAVRTASQLISYELSIMLSMIVVLIFTGTLDIQKIILSQTNGWWLWRGHVCTFVAFFIFFIASIAELNKPPFDLPEGESELGAGFHTEYSGMQFAFFFLAEYVNLFTTSSIIVALFLGGWLPIHVIGFPILNTYMNNIPSMMWFFIKTMFILFLIMWIRWTFPRLRIDQLIALEWKILLPLSLLNIIVTSVCVLNNFYFYPL